MGARVGSIERGFRITIWDLDGVGYNAVNPKQSWWWRDLAKVCGRRSLDNWFDSNNKWIMGDGRRVKFWEDAWEDDKPLRDKFLRLFSISECKDRVVAEVGIREQENSMDINKWNLVWRRDRFEWEKMLEEQLINCISEVQQRNGCQNGWACLGND